MGELTDPVKDWRKNGQYEEIFGHNIFCYFRQSSSSIDEETWFLVLLHGFPTCSFDWSKMLPYLEDSSQIDTMSILAFDFLGFGLSDKPKEHDYTLTSAADLTIELIKRYLDRRELNKQRIFFVAHDMATSVLAEILAREIDGALPRDWRVSGSLLFNGNMDMSKASMIIGQKLLRSPLGSILSHFNTKWISKWQLGSVMSPKSQIGSELDDQWSLVCFNEGNRILHRTIRYTFERVEKADRLLGSIRDTKIPLVYLWGMDDPVATVSLQLESWKQLRPSAPIHKLENVGHYPQIEAPSQFAQILLSILQRKKNFDA